jgi:hypothetical protein
MAWEVFKRCFILPSLFNLFLLLNRLQGQRQFHKRFNESDLETSQSDDKVTFARPQFQDVD